MQRIKLYTHQKYALGLLVAAGCGNSTDRLDRLAAAGLIHKEAPVQAHLEIQIAAPVARVWSLLVDAPAWPRWAGQIESVTASGPLASGSSLTWKTGGTTVHSRVQLLEPERRLSWTGRALTAHAIHVWELKPAAGGTTVEVSESMDGPLMKRIFPSEKLAESDREWLAALKLAAERKP